MLGMDNTVDHPVTLEIDGKVAVIPASDRWLSNSRVFLIGQTEMIKYIDFRVPAAGEREVDQALLAERDLDVFSVCRRVKAGNQQ
tara:strand:- start:8246 stop:8500 length:255 start_codon:yes stop_codon:yes gene_type:complete